MLENINQFFGIFVGYLAPILFMEINGFPLIVLVLLFGAIIFTLYFRFINVRAFKHSIDIIKGKYDNPKDTGQISHFQALTSALSATIGLGNIAGVAVAVSLGGAGAVFWMILIAFFSMSAKFVSCTLGQTYRKINSDGSVSGGPMYYLSQGLSERKKDGWILNKGAYPVLGKILGAMYAIFIIGGAFGGGNMFQANQSYELFGKLIGIPDYLYGIILAFLVGIVIIGGIKRIGQTTEKIVPFMVVLYIVAALFIIFTNLDKIPNVLSSIFNQAFNTHAAFGGFIGGLVTGIKRAVFSNEGGVGSASIAHSAAKTDEPVREGIVAMIGPFIDTIVVCFMTASVILITAESNPLDVTNAKLYIMDNLDELTKEERNEGSYSDIYKYSIGSFDRYALLIDADNKYISAIDTNTILESYSTPSESFKIAIENGEIDAPSTELIDVVSTENFATKLYLNYSKEWEIKNSEVTKWWKINFSEDDKSIIYTKHPQAIYNLNDKKFIDDIKGAELTSAAFGSAISWFPYILSIVVFLFSFSTMISWYYYGNKGWNYLFGSSSIKVYQGMYLGCVVLGAVASLGNVIDFSDMMILSCGFPNIVGCLFLLPILKTKLDKYWDKYQAGEFKTYK